MRQIIIDMDYALQDGTVNNSEYYRLQEELEELERKAEIADAVEWAMIDTDRLLKAYREGNKS